MFVFLGCGKEAPITDINATTNELETTLSDEASTDGATETDLSFCLNSNFVTSEPMIVESGVEVSNELSDWLICDNYDNIEVSIDIADSENDLKNLPGVYFPISSPYKITFTNKSTGETLYTEVQVVGGKDRDPATFDITSDPNYCPDIDEDIVFEPELYNENENYFYCTNLSVLSKLENLPTLAIADFTNQVGKFIIPLAEAGDWEKPESCYVLESSFEETEDYSRFDIYIIPNQNLEIQVTYYYETGYEFIITKT